MAAIKLFLLCLLPGIIYGKSVRQPFQESESSTYSIILTQDKNTWDYYGQISIGTPSQNFSVIFSTEIHHTWVPAVGCSSSFCESRNKYSSAESATYEQNGESEEISSQEFKVKGILSSDNLNIAGMNVTGQTFVEASEVSGNIENYLNVDGVVGLGSPLFSDNSLISSMVAQGLIGKKVFSVFLNGNSESTNVDGEIVFGGANPEHQKENFVYVQTMMKGKWMIPIKKVDIGGILLNRFESTTIVDISSNWLTGPSRDIYNIFDAIGAELDAYSRDYLVDCSKIDSLPTLNFHLGSYTLSLEGKDYITKYVSMMTPVCGTIFLPKNQETWTFGKSVISKYYTQFDLERNRIGFAEAK